MFSQESKLAVLESKLNIYEDLSREMLSKLEAAVDKISEGNNRIAMILAKHDERIEQSIKSDALIIKMIEDMKDSNSKEHSQVIQRIEKVENRVNELATFRWITVGIATAAAVIISSAGFFGNLLTTGNTGSTLGGANTTLSK
jgi:hypothetical protein